MPRITDELNENISELKKSKNKLSKSLLDAQQLLRYREDLLKALHNAQKARINFKRKTEDASSRIARIKKVDKALIAAKNKASANENKLRQHKALIEKQEQETHNLIDMCQQKSNDISNLRNHPDRLRFAEKYDPDLQFAPDILSKKLERELDKAEKVLNKMPQVQKKLRSIN